MTALILDTSSNDALLVLTQDAKIIDSFIFSHEQHLSSHLTPSIKNLLKKTNLSPKNLDYIAVGMGPGSYTGTRVGVAVAKSLALALEIPLIPFCSLLAFVPPSIEGSFVYLMDSKQGAPFVLKATAYKDQYEKIVHSLVSTEQLPDYLADAQNRLQSLPLSNENLPRLASHLFFLFQNQTYVSWQELASVDLFYLHNLPVQPMAMCSYMP